MNIKKSVLLFVIVAAMAIIALGFVQGGFQPTFVKNETSGYEAGAEVIQPEIPIVLLPTVAETIIATTAPTTVPTPEQTVVATVATTAPTAVGAIVGEEWKSSREFQISSQVAVPLNPERTRWKVTITFNNRGNTPVKAEKLLWGGEEIELNADVHPRASVVCPIGEQPTPQLKPIKLIGYK